MWILVVGAGVSVLARADVPARSGQDVEVYEASERVVALERLR